MPQLALFSNILYTPIHRDFFVPSPAWMPKWMNCTQFAGMCPISMTCLKDAAFATVALMQSQFAIASSLVSIRVGDTLVSCWKYEGGHEYGE